MCRSVVSGNDHHKDSRVYPSRTAGIPPAGSPWPFLLEFATSLAESCKNQKFSPFHPQVSEKV